MTRTHVESATQPRSRATRMLAGAAMLVTLLAVASVRPVEVKAGSMLPTLAPGETVLVERATALAVWRRGGLRQFRGTIAVLDSPNGVPIIKRVAAIAGDKVAIDGDQVFVNRRGPWSASGAGPRHLSALDLQRIREFVIPPNQIFVLGDNGADSFDSRQFGPVAVANVHGFVLSRLW